MSNADEIRWRQRLDNFSNALDQLSAACGQPDYTDLERSGLVQTFEFSFELAWKTLQDLLFYEGYEAQSPRPVIRQSFVAGCLDENDCETLTKLAWHPLMGLLNSHCRCGATDSALVRLRAWPYVKHRV